MYRMDITADLNDEDHTGYVWPFLSRHAAPASVAHDTDYTVVFRGDRNGSSSPPATFTITVTNPNRIPTCFEPN